MKKLALICMSVILLISVGCSSKKEGIKEENDKKAVVSEEVNGQKAKVKKTEKEEKEEEKKEDAQISQSSKTREKGYVNAIYFEHNQSIVFDKAISAEQLETFISNDSKDEVKNNSVLRVEIEGDKISSLKVDKEMEVFGKYVGLSDSNVAEFSYDGHAFRLEIMPEQMEALEAVSENQLLSLKVEQINADRSNLKLLDFTVK